MSDQEDSQNSELAEKPKSSLGRLLRFLENWAEKPGVNQHEKASKITLLLVAALAWESYGSDLIRIVLAIA